MEGVFYLASCGYVVACVDGRGTGNRSREWANCVYKQLGKYETEDQIAGARHFASPSIRGFIPCGLLRVELRRLYDPYGTHSPGFSLQSRHIHGSCYGLEMVRLNIYGTLYAHAPTE